MKEYLDLVRHVMQNTHWTGNRTKQRTLSEPGLHLRLDMQKGFPAITTKKIAFKSAVAEILGYMRGYTSAADFRALGTKTWDANANLTPEWLANPYRVGTDSLGPVYGAQFRSFPAYKLLTLGAPNVDAQIADAKGRGYKELGVIEAMNEDGKVARVLLHKSIDQVREAMDKLISNPTDRRMIFHAWNPAQLEEIALPSCPTLWQFHVKPHVKELSLSVFTRSQDLGLGAPFNYVEAGLLLHLVARLTGYAPRWLSITMGDAHVYERHVDMLT